MNEPKNRSFYSITIQTLKTLDEKQLLEMFHDINDIEIIERINYAAQEFIGEKCFLCKKIGIYGGVPVKADYICVCKECFDNESTSNEKSDFQDAKEIDDAQRYRDLK